MISAQGMLPIRTLASRLAVSEMTVRRDLAELELGHPSDGEEGGYSLLQELEKANAQKEQIGRAAAALIAVSYTHLDVYKRQSLPRARAKRPSPC